MSETSRHFLRATMGCAIVGGEDGYTIGDVAPLTELPKNARRRLSSFDRMVARCIVGVSRDAKVEDSIVLGSSYGNMQLTLNLLVSLCDRELLSPADFSHSVHNAAVGVASQIVSNHAGHTAVSAGSYSARAALIEATVRLRCSAAGVILLLADEPLPGVYEKFDADADQPAVCLAARLTLEPEAQVSDAWQAEHNLGRRGMIDLAQRLSAPPCWLAWT